MTKKEKQILFEATEEAWRFTKMFKNEQDKVGQQLYKMNRSEFTTLYDLCDKLGVREEYIQYTVQKQREMYKNFPENA